MSGPKTRANDLRVDDFLDALQEEQVRDDCRTVIAIMQSATKADPRMWGTNIVGFGDYRSVYANGKDANWMLTGFSPRKKNLTLYIMDGLERHGELTSRLGAHSSGKTCLYIKRLADIHLPTLKMLVQASVRNRIRAHSQANPDALSRNEVH